MCTRLSRDRSPETIVTQRWGRSRASARKATRAALAAPSTGGAARRIRIAPPRSPSTRLRGARGITRTLRIALAGGLAIVDPRLRPRRRSGLGLTRTMEQDLLLGAVLVLIADELERPVERLDRRLERPFGVAAAQLELVDVAIHLLEANLRLLEQQIRASLRLAHDQLRLVLRDLLELVGHPLRGEQSVAQVVFPLAMLPEQGLHPHQVGAQPIDLAHRMLVVVGRFREERDHVGAVVAAEGRA